MEIRNNVSAQKILFNRMLAAIKAELKDKQDYKFSSVPSYYDMYKAKQYTTTNTLTE